ncbi:hypothetical protein [Streptosporangium sp. NPDC051022]|uniref:hypothetical protein n=1 Tax=Streptosporangium sp. NPDC051022 TaxID=3155752 RepID=UPI003435A806
MRQIFQADPSRLCAVEEADRHHEQVHGPFARDVLLRESPRVTRYSWNRVERSRDLSGRFDRRPGAWRFIFLDSEPRFAGDPEARVPGHLSQRVLHDHVNFLRDMRCFEAEPAVAADRRSGQCSTAKFLLVVEVTRESRRDELVRLRRELVSALAEHLPTSDGGRLLVTNEIVREMATAPIEEPGQLPTGEFRQVSSRLAVDELYCDNATAGVELLTCPAVREIIDGFLPDELQGHLVREWVGFDRS